jgi:hypothetical protein
MNKENERDYSHSQFPTLLRRYCVVCGVWTKFQHRVAVIRRSNPVDYTVPKIIIANKKLSDLAIENYKKNLFRTEFNGKDIEEINRFKYASRYISCQDKQICEYLGIKDQDQVRAALEIRKQKIKKLLELQKQRFY